MRKINLFRLSLLLLLALPLSGCLSSGARNSGAGGSLSYTCHMPVDYDLYQKGVSYTPTPPALWNNGVGVMPCYPADGVNFEDGKTLSVSGDHRQLPEYLYFWWSRVPQGTRAAGTMTEAQEQDYLRIVKDPPTYWSRVAIRSQVPQSIVDEIIASPPAKIEDGPAKGRNSGQNVLTLHIYISWTERGIELTWAEFRHGVGMIKYGGAVPSGPSGTVEPWLKAHPDNPSAKHPELLSYQRGQDWIAKNHVQFVPSHVATPAPYWTWPPK